MKLKFVVHALTGGNSPTPRKGHFL